MMAELGPLGPVKRGKVQGAGAVQTFLPGTLSGATPGSSLSFSIQNVRFSVLYFPLIIPLFNSIQRLQPIEVLAVPQKAIVSFFFFFLVCLHICPLCLKQT